MKIKLKISIFGMLMLLILLYGDNSTYTLIALMAASIHELGHILCAIILKIKLNNMSIGILGARIDICENKISYKKEILLSISGPLANIITGTVGLLMNHICKNTVTSDYILFFIVASFFLAGLNLLPIKSFDGGRIFFCILTFFIELYTAEKIIGLVSFVFILFLWSISIYLMLKLGTSLTLFVFSGALFVNLFLENK